MLPLGCAAAPKNRAASRPSGSKLPRHKGFLRDNANSRQDYVTDVGRFPPEKPDNIVVPAKS
ncbi:hypothetical protein B0E42_04930 [Pseudomonas sp. A25(2017)]|nr:hypothetical protein B0E42_04930 [Pseudomonas sp. A25(2017)]OPG69192.1 hypothetical protein B1219_28345 [Pseudomonas ogarae]OPG80908.1 hypothetical protein B1218_02815 [Pseudomonas ogarae]